jgi:hypothetical protein
MLDALMLQERVLPHVILVTALNIARVFPLLLNTILSSPMLKPHVPMEGAAPVLSSELAGATLMQAAHGTWVRC